MRQSDRIRVAHRGKSAVGARFAYLLLATAKLKDVCNGSCGIPRYIETANTSFVEGDLMRCQTFTNGHLKKLLGVFGKWCGSDGVWVDPREFRRVSLPEPGDECVLMGNIRDKNRQNLYPHIGSLQEDGQPVSMSSDGVRHDTRRDVPRLSAYTRLGNL